MIIARWGGANVVQPACNLGKRRLLYDIEIIGGGGGGDSTGVGDGSRELPKDGGKYIK